MSSFTCPHLDLENDYCLRLKTDCVPERTGCVLRNDEFLIPAEDRLRAKEEEKRVKAFSSVTAARVSDR